MTTVDKALFDCSLELRRLLQPNTTSDSGTTISSEINVGMEVKLPMIEVPTFDRNILSWRIFWEQFSVAVHNHENICDSEKLVYLRHALKDSKVLKVIERLFRSREHYVEATELLQARFNRPCLIHQTHVSRILNASSLHDTVQQHLRALKSMDYEPSVQFITSILELKLDTMTMFEWQKHSLLSTEVPHYPHLLEFNDLLAQASETSATEQAKRSSRVGLSIPKKSTIPNLLQLTSSQAHIYSQTGNNCVVCNDGSKHPLYVCGRFKALSHENKLTLLKNSKLCLNCLKPGRFVNMCRSNQYCKGCQGPHPTLCGTCCTHTQSKQSK